MTTVKVETDDAMDIAVGEVFDGLKIGRVAVVHTFDLSREREGSAVFFGRLVMRVGEELPDRVVGFKRQEDGSTIVSLDR